MNVLRNVLAIVLGLLIGSGINMALVIAGPAVIPLPANVDVTDPDSIAAAMPLFEAHHFLFPFMAHALGTLVGATVAWFVATGHRQRFAWAIGLLFLAGGITNAFMLPAPAWFVVTDLLLAYLPMAWLGTRIGARLVPG